MNFKAYKPNDVFRNTIKCKRKECGTKYDVEFTYKRFLHSRIMQTMCPAGHVQPTVLRLVYEDSGMIRLIDRVNFERGVC